MYTFLENFLAAQVMNGRLAIEKIPTETQSVVKQIISESQSKPSSEN